VIGGGLGGLCLASGLHEGGLRVTVYEKDSSAAARAQGYRLHLDRRGDDALRKCLPTRLYEMHRATCSPPSEQFSVMTKRLRTIKVVSSGSTASSSTSVDRATLSAVLLAELEGVVRFGAEFTGYELLAVGGVRANFADGSIADADVLVGADGINSLVRKQLVPEARLADTGIRVVYSKTPLTERMLPLVPAPLHRGFVAVTAIPRRHGMALGLMRVGVSPEELGLPPARDHMMWGFSAPERDFLGRAVPELIRSWHPDLRSLVDNCDPTQTFTVDIRRAVEFTPWMTGPVILLGGAAHAMSPSRGSGTNMALRDVGRLSGLLAAARCGELPLRQALHDYEEVMLREGFEQVAASERTPREWFRRSRRRSG
jgi:2-polyprenyl-6-methoxyphenol hydroxylase-like FAD-dependent oxidoreductase